MQRHTTIPVLFLLLGSALVGLLAFTGYRSNVEQIRIETGVTADQVQIRLQSCVDMRQNLVRALAEMPWASAQQLEASWAARAANYYPLAGGIQALNYVDTSGTIRSVFPVEANRAALNANLRVHPNDSVTAALRLAETSNTVARSNLVELLQSGLGFAVYQAIRSDDGELLGFVNGVFRSTDLLTSCLYEQQLRENFLVSVFEGDRLFFQQPGEAGGYQPQRVTRLVNVAGLPWRVEISPLKEHVDNHSSILDLVWVALGMLLSIMLALAVRGLLLKQKDLRESEDKYRLLVENQTDMLVKVNPEGRFLYVSPSYCKAFGKSEADLVGKHFMPLVHEEDRELTARSLASLNDPPHSSYHEQRAMTKHGWRWLGWSNTGVLDDAGKISAITAVGRDVTEIKKWESRLAHAQKMRALGEMAGGITHDFNNLLQVIFGNVDFMLLKAGRDAEDRERLERIGQVAERGMRLTQKLATLSRQEVSRKEVIDLNDFASELLALLKHTLPSSIILSLQAPAEPLLIEADKTLLEQVLLNLAFNARDALEGAGHLSLKLKQQYLGLELIGRESEMKPGDHALIEVTDSGCGIEPDVLPRIFDPFFTTKSKDAGSGLGLANCYSIVKQHQGLILVESVPGQGTTFSIYLPLAEVPAAVAPAVTAGS